MIMCSRSINWNTDSIGLFSTTATYNEKIVSQNPKGFPSTGLCTGNTFQVPVTKSYENFWFKNYVNNGVFELRKFL